MKSLEPFATPLMVVSALWLLAPAWAPVHVEGFTASMASIGLHLAHDRIANFDPVNPFNLEFFALSRLGANLFIAGLVGPLHLPADWAMRLMMWAGLILLMGGSTLLVRRWAGVSGRLAFAAVLILAGPAETAFFYNDNLLSAGLAVVSLAVLSWRTDWIATVAAGALFGLAVLVRFDAAMLAPAAALIVWGQERRAAPFLGRGLAMAVAALSALWPPLAVFGVTPLTLLEIAGYAVTLWARGTSLVQQVFWSLMFAGAAGLICAGLGLAALARERDWRRALLLAGMPALYSVVSLGKVWEPRQLVMLTPFLGALAALALKRLLQVEPPSLAAPGRVLVWTALAAAVVVPPLVPSISDGPHAMVGRLWSPIQWLSWQAASRSDFARIGGFVQSLPPQQTSVVLTDSWNADRYLHLQLQQNGFHPTSLGQADCAALGQAFENGGRRVIQLSLQPPFLPDWAQRIPGRWDAHVPACLAEAGAAQVFYMAPAARVAALFGAEAPHGPWDKAAQADAARSGWWRIGLNDAQAAFPLAPNDLARLRRGYSDEAAQALADQGPPAGPSPEVLLAARTPVGRGERP